MNKFLERIEAVKAQLYQDTGTRPIAFVHPEDMIVLQAKLYDKSLWTIITTFFKPTRAIKDMEVLSSRLVPYGIVRMVSKGHSVDIPFENEL